jgi:hypothetical protein
VAEVSLQRPRIVALIGQRKTTGMAQHVRMGRKPSLPLAISAFQPEPSHHAQHGLV